MGLSDTSLQVNALYVDMLKALKAASSAIANPFMEKGKTRIRIYYKNPNSMLVRLCFQVCYKPVYQYLDLACRLILQIG